MSRALPFGGSGDNGVILLRVTALTLCAGARSRLAISRFSCCTAQWSAVEPSAAAV